MKLALIGDPVEHSRSPEIHARFLREAGIAGSYETIRVPAGGVAAALRDLETRGYDGCNVTSPLKEEAALACVELTSLARSARAVNTIALAGRSLGTNTDGTGAAVALRCHLGSLRDREILVLGTGPAGRAIALGLAAEGARIAIWGRKLPFQDEGRTFHAAFSALVPNATLPDGIVRILETLPLVMDANYGERSTLGAQLGRAVIDGSEMLEAQARASFEFWRTTV